MIPRVSEFVYKDIRRVVIEKGPDARGCGLFTRQIVPEPGFRTFKPAKMSHYRKLGLFKTLWYLIKGVV